MDKVQFSSPISSVLNAGKAMFATKPNNQVSFQSKFERTPVVDTFELNNAYDNDIEAKLSEDDVFDCEKYDAEQEPINLLSPIDYKDEERRRREEQCIDDAVLYTAVLMSPTAATADDIDKAENDFDLDYDNDLKEEPMSEYGIYGEDGPPSTYYDLNNDDLPAFDVLDDFLEDIF